MTAPVGIFPGAATAVPIGGTPVVAAYGFLSGGIIANPATAAEQGIPFGENLYVDFTGPAATIETATTQAIYPGASVSIPANTTKNVSVNAATSGHRFSCIIFQAPTPFVPTTSPFPPQGPVTLTETIPSYLYQEYSDDDDLQAFVDAFNNLAQEYVTWFAEIGLPIYTSDNISNTLLDWVAQNLYGVQRPVLAAGGSRNYGPFNTVAFNTLPFNGRKVIQTGTYFATNDDIFKRVITWNFFKGDGRIFDIRWLKRRVMRFLTGPNGSAPNVDSTYQISVTFGAEFQVVIRIVQYVRTFVSGAVFNGFAFNKKPFNQLVSSLVTFPPIPLSDTLKEAVEAGVLQLPFQYTWVVQIG